MGSMWSSYETFKNNEQLAFDDLDGLVWDISQKITLETVQARLKLHSVYHWLAAENLYKKFKNLEAEQVGKQNFFFKKNVNDLYVFHASMAIRYTSMMAHLVTINYDLK